MTNISFPAIIRGSAVTRPADTTAYASGDLVANSTTAGSVVPSSLETGQVDRARQISRVRLLKSGTVLTNAQFRMHLYRTKPTPANGDNGAWSTDQASEYLGSIDVTIDKAFTDGSIGEAWPTSTITFAPGSQTDFLYILLEARAAYTPVSAEVFTPIIEMQ